MSHKAPVPFFNACLRGVLPSGVRFSSVYITLFSLCLSFFICAPALEALALPPQRIVVQNPTARIEDSMLRVLFSLTVDDEDGLRDMLKDGAVLALTVSTELERARSWWSDEKIVAAEFTSVIWHDPLTRNFIITMPESGQDKQYRDKNLTRLLYGTWHGFSLPILSLSKLLQQGKDAQYKITITISLQHTEVPPWLENARVFWSSDVVPQESFTLPFQLPDSMP